MKTDSTIRDLMIFFLLAVMVPGARAKEKESAANAAPANLVWPVPPDKPRVKFLEMYSNNFDIEPKRKQGWMDKMVGNGDPNKVENFYQPAGLAVDSHGQLYMVSTQKGELFIINKEQHQVFRFVGDRGVRLQVPIGVAIDAHNNFYVADAKARTVYKFNPDHTIAGSFGGDQLKNPTYLAIDESRRRLYVVDSKLHQVLVFNLDNLQLLSTVGKRGDKNGQFNFPIGIGVAPSGNFAVTDTGSCSVQIFDPDYKFVRRIGKQGTAPGQFVRPKGVTYDSEGNLWVVDGAFNNFQIFNDKGQVLLFVGSFGDKAGEFSLPSGIFIDRNNRVYVGDQLNHRVQVFQFLGGS